MRSSQDVRRAPAATGWTPVGFATYASSCAMPLVHAAVLDSKADLRTHLNELPFLSHGIQTYGKSTSVQLRCVLSGRSSRRIADRVQKRVIAAGLLPILRKEVEHLEQDNIISRPREVDVRATCGTLPIVSN